MVSIFAGQNLFGGRFSQIGQAKPLVSSRNRVATAQKNHYATDGAAACRHASGGVPKSPRPPSIEIEIS
jgi:hypothetical protein